MSAAFFDNSDELNTLFHLLGDAEKPKYSSKEIDGFCEDILINFNNLLEISTCFEILQADCLNRYKLNFSQVFEAEDINLNEMPNYQTNSVLWHNFIKTSFLMVSANQDSLNLISPKLVTNFLNIAKKLDEALQLKLHLYK
ncbi:hypothetical protein SCLARK_00984 [Spiroplasma clarkii]|uniref:Uncharacterized protein n=1 Tax=Spiroplasma clarkii TaxID=2139 RepID=A0A1Y0L1K3_9MOLU|nr:hypothetical protein [Spiroplasma clarkii]ARU91579.1 hypothetical protein SCLARK_00984 [Spiroplasma clarkii]ATX70979.1 hypothetical protein SCLAR_v1c06620 [Spiroplasma clarkii]